MPKSSLISLYYSLVYPYLIYCLPVWGATYNEHLKPPIVLQKKCLRTINGLEFGAHTNSHFHSDKILNFVDLYRVELGTCVFNNLDKFSDCLRTHTYETRYNSTMLPAYNRLTSTQHSIIFTGPSLWNTIPEKIRSSPSKTAFRKRYTRHLISLYDS